MTDELSLAERAGIQWFDYQRDAFALAETQVGDAQQRLCLYYKTGAGKSLTALGCLALWGHTEAVVVCPPRTHLQWKDAGDRMGVTVHPMSHARFRMKDTKLSKSMAVVADEFHLFGGHGGSGWKKLDRLALGLQAPLILASATPNYNDAERCYCIQHVLDPHSVKGGYLEFIYSVCNTEQNPFGMEPLVNKGQPFRNFKDAAHYLSSLPKVAYVPDDLVYKIEDLPVPENWPLEAERYGLNTRAGRIMASQMEERHARVALSLIDEDGLLTRVAFNWLKTIIDGAKTPVLIFANHSTVADAADRALAAQRYGVGSVTGSTSKKKADARMAAFRDGALRVLIGTASLATGTDGLDKVCDTMVILDDTDDAAMRRQLVGRIMPRGSDTDASLKRVYRLVLS